MITLSFKQLNNKTSPKYRGVTLLELLVTIFISLILINTAVYYQDGAVEKAKITALKQTLDATRKAIDTYYEVNLPKRYPTLEELVPGYLRSKPFDPITQNYLWIIIKEDTTTCLSTDIYTGAYDIKSTDLRYINL